MAYQLKYYKELVSHGHQWRLEIYQDTEVAIEAVEIGPVLQGLRLIMQGDQADIDTPIVKTSLEMVFVDAPDLEDERKCGYWEEFYTSSATEYRVRLIKDRNVEWTGYVTPDSFSESLQYRGSVTIIARDNLGALQDFDFSYASQDGLVSLRQLLYRALEVIDFPMRITFSSDGDNHSPIAEIETIASDLRDVMFNTFSFDGKTWLEVLEDVLYATGMTLRYRGGNAFVWVPLRSIPLCGSFFWFDVPVLDVQFCAYGQRELSPAVKRIVEEVSFDIEEDIADIDMPIDAFGEESTFTFYRLMAQSGAISKPTDYVPVHAIVGGSLQYREPSKSLAFNALKYPLKEGHSSRKLGDIHDPAKVFIAANGGANIEDDARDVEYKLLVGPGDYDIEMTFGNPIALYDDLTKVGHIDVEVEMTQLKMLLNYQSIDGAVKLRYDVGANKWVSGVATRDNTGYIFPNVKFPYTISVEPLPAEVKGYVSLTITRVSATQLEVVTPASRGMYVPFDVAIKDKSIETTQVAQRQKITTKYNENNNILLTRNVNYGFNPSDVASPHIIKNGMFIDKDGWYESSDKWSFTVYDEPQPLPVLIHQQLLAYYAKPNNVLTGELATDNPLFNALYKWNGKNHLLTSGALNIITGRMENVVLREFMRYDHMWETWVETDDVEVDYGATSIQLRVHSDKPVTSADLLYLPIWMIGSVQDDVDGVYIVSLAIEANSSVKRNSFINIKSALVRITQLGPGDYGMDYGKDYS